eukprot:TRINITY_DN122583_c0_g1_i1.p1 TRINITY_DN122583_c0_g1~~TRINITY_DN122583_c0_g1_i1.p1  ORF type:complete len:308 (-),score=63.79 TRINITY_DN122583_c0_g1_i1:97-933(-)
MGGDDSIHSLVPFETIVRKGVLVKEIEERKQALIEQCRSNNGLTLQEVVDHNDWLLQIERDLSKARARIERDFRISNALSVKVREGKRKAQLQQRLDVLRSQCDVLNECIRGLSEHCAWFQESGTYREAVEFLEGRWEDDEGHPMDDPRFDINTCGLKSVGGQSASHAAANDEDGHAHELDGLIHGDVSAPSQEKKRRKKKKRKGGPAGGDDSRGGLAENSEDDEDADGGREADGAHPNSTGLGSGADALCAAADFQWLKAAGKKGDLKDYVDVWSPD